MSTACLTLVFPDAKTAAVKEAQAATIPIVGFDAGVDNWKQEDLLPIVFRPS